MKTEKIYQEFAERGFEVPKKLDDILKNGGNEEEAWCCGFAAGYDEEKKKMAVVKYCYRKRGSQEKIKWYNKEGRVQKIQEIDRRDAALIRKIGKITKGECVLC